MPLFFLHMICSIQIFLFHSSTLLEIIICCKFHAECSVIHIIIYVRNAKIFNLIPHFSFAILVKLIAIVCVSLNSIPIPSVLLSTSYFFCAYYLCSLIIELMPLKKHPEQFLYNFCN